MHSLSRQLFYSQRQPSLKAMSELRKIIQQVASLSKIPQAISNAMLLCFSEAATNIVEHNPNAKLLGVELRSSSTEWQLILLDDGEPFSGYKNIHNAALDVTMAFAEGGRGLGLMGASSDEVVYVKKTDQSEQANLYNRLTFTWFARCELSKPRLLVVDDEPALRRLYQVMLEEFYEVVCAGSGTEAIECVEKELFERNKSFDAIVSDISMPEMDGISLREQLLIKPGAELTPFIFLTMAEDDETNERANGLGIDDYLSKPVTKDQLVRTLHRSLTRSHQLVDKITQRLNKKLSDTLVPEVPSQLFGWNLAFAQRGTGLGGGDLVLLDRRESCAFLVLIDIMGHDESAKFFAHAYGGYIRGMLANVSDNLLPGDVLDRLSSAAFDDQLLRQTTLSCIVLKITPDELHIASAAHPAPLVITEQGVQAMLVGGMLPGLMEGQKYQSLSVAKKNAERICLYTDGLFESAEGVEGRKILKDELSSIMYQTRKTALEESLLNVMATFDYAAGSPPADDTTVIMVEADHFR